MWPALEQRIRTSGLPTGFEGHSSPHQADPFVADRDLIRGG
jgi:hypothetical protein